MLRKESASELDSRMIRFAKECYANGGRVPLLPSSRWEEFCYRIAKSFERRKKRERK